MNSSSKKMRNMKTKSIEKGKKCKTRPSTASNNGENSTKKPFLELWEGLKSVKLVQIQQSTQAKISQKSQFQGGAGQISTQPFNNE